MGGKEERRLRGLTGRALAAAWIIAVLAAVPAYAHHSYPATYSGPAAAGGTVEFDVSADGVSVTRFQVTSVPTTCGTISATATGSFSIANHGFSNGSPTALNLRFSGSFPTFRNAQGVMSFRVASPACTSADVSWNASTSAGLPPQCNDGADNDFDGAVDFPADPGCTSTSDNDETDAPTPQCSDGIDNDGDGKVDYPADPGCTSPGDNDEFNVPPPPPCPDAQVASHHVYRGTHQAGGTVCFTVAPDWSGVSSFHTENVPGSPCTFTFARSFFTPALPINNRSFSTSGGGLFASLSGTFPSASGAQGAFRLQSSGPFGSTCGTGTMSWTAATNDSPPWAAASGSPSDKSAPKWTLAGNTTQRVLRQGGVVVVVACLNEPCTATAKGTISVPGQAKLLRLKAVTKRIAQGGKAKLKLRLGKKAARAVKRALRKRKKVKARISVAVRDDAGNGTVQKRTIRVKR
jgi:hypothetical protein